VQVFVKEHSGTMFMVPLQKEVGVRLTGWQVYV